MNILPFVLAILMLMSIMTYAKLQSFISSTALRSEYVCFMKVASRSQFNDEEKARYDEQHVKGSEKDPIERAAGTRKINLSLFSNREFRDKYYSSVPTYRSLLRRLMQVLFSDKAYFQEMEETRPDFLNELIDALEEEMLALDSAEKPVTKVSQLSYLTLPDEELQNVFNHMLRQITNMEKVSQICRKQAKADQSVSTQTLADYVEFNKTQLPPFRIFLAGRPVLLAIYQDRALVDEIIQERKRLYQELKSIPKDQRNNEKKRLSQEFLSLFGNRGPLGITPDMLNFQVSLTKPKS